MEITNQLQFILSYSAMVNNLKNDYRQQVLSPIGLRSYLQEHLDQILLRYLKG
ncbi:MAG: hypothetical protein RJQ09_14860 [Cyclobacteriaceae bacterium]